MRTCIARANVCNIRTSSSSLRPKPSSKHIFGAELAPKLGDKCVWIQDEAHAKLESNATACTMLHQPETDEQPRDREPSKLSSRLPDELMLEYALLSILASAVNIADTDAMTGLGLATRIPMARRSAEQWRSNSGSRKDCSHVRDRRQYLGDTATANRLRLYYRSMF